MDFLSLLVLLDVMESVKNMEKVPKSEARMVAVSHVRTDLRVGSISRTKGILEQNGSYRDGLLAGLAVLEASDGFNESVTVEGNYIDDADSIYDEFTEILEDDYSGEAITGFRAAADCEEDDEYYFIEKGFDWVEEDELSTGSY